MDEGKYFQQLSRLLEPHPVIRLMHYEPNKLDNARMIHATAYNVGRALALKEGADYLLTLESDVIPNPYDLLRLYCSLHSGHSIDTVLSGVTPYSNNSTVIYKSLAVNYYDGQLRQPLSLPTCRGDKIYFTELDVEMIRAEKWLPDYDFFSLDEINEWDMPKQVSGCSLGFTLIPRKVLEDVRFRHVEESRAFADAWFSFDVYKTGHRIVCNPFVQPLHLFKQWPREMMQ